jgi:signal transduction histidine kinase
LSLEAQADVSPRAGFSAAKRMLAGFGLTGMQARGERIGGTVTITSAPGKGTTVAVRVPTDDYAGAV